ncbi:MAG TPA: PAS domain-containing sensor histidine kinase [Candidatus Dormibacteraeota bacterium]|nr:PAS domain-containing sensor histidine kinase [Candidatus Dormibacteraeota bacterium]
MAAIAVVAFSLWLLLNLGGMRVATAVDDFGELAAALLAAIGCAVAACRTRGRSRVAWALIAVSCGSWAAGEAAWSYVEVIRGLRVGNPSPADFGFLSAVPFGVAGLLLFAAPARRGWERMRALVDSLLIAACFLFISWEFLLWPIYRTSLLSPMAKLVTLAYPVGDVAMLTIAAFALSRVRRESRTSVMLLAAGIFGLSIAGSASAYLSATGSYSGSAVDTGWMAGFLLILLASLRSRTDSLHREDSGETPVGLVRMLIPNLALLAALVCGSWVLFSGGNVGQVALGIALTAATFTLASNLLVQFENQGLLESRLVSERALVDSRRALLQVVDSAPVILFAINPAGTLTLVTGAGLAGFSERAANLEGRNVREVVRDSPEFLAAVEAALAGRPGQPLTRFEHGDLDVRLLPVTENGALVSVSGVAIDVSERRRAEVARGESEAKSRFLATMTHELRTPLNSILGFAELLLGERRGPLNEQQRRYVGNVLGSGRHLLALITDLLDLSRVAAGEVEVNLQRVNLAEAVQEAADKIRPMAERKRLELTVDEPGPPEVMADPLRLQQVLLNLLSNAVKFTASGGAIGIGSRPDGGRVQIAVRDTGVGIRPEHRDLIFDQYSQLDGPDGPVREGIGLGLAVSRRLAVLMNGSLDVESTVGAGSVFLLRLEAPASRSATAGAALPAELQGIKP